MGKHFCEECGSEIIGDPIKVNGESLCVGCNRTLYEETEEIETRPTDWTVFGNTISLYHISSQSYLRRKYKVDAIVGLFDRVRDDVIEIWDLRTNRKMMVKKRYIEGVDTIVRINSKDFKEYKHSLWRCRGRKPDILNELFSESMIEDELRDEIAQEIADSAA